MRVFERRATAASAAVSARTSFGLHPSRARVGAMLTSVLLLATECHADTLEKAEIAAGTSECSRQTLQASIVDLLDLLGVFATARVQTDAMVEQLRRQNPKVLEGFWSRFAEGVSDRATLISLYAPIYRHHLAQQDICALVSFYRTPLGAHYLQAGPRIQEAARDAIQAWAATMALDLLRSRGAAGAPEEPQSPRRTSQTLPEDARTAEIHELMRRSGDLATAQQTMGMTLDGLRQSSQQMALPPTFWDDARKRLLNGDDLLRVWTPAYAREYTAIEVRRLLEFYRSAAGSHYAAALPAIEAERLDAGRGLGRDVAKRAVREVYGPLPQWRVLHPAKSGPAAPKSQDQGSPRMLAPQ